MLPVLTAVAADMDAYNASQTDDRLKLHEYYGSNHPGKPWRCYRRIKLKEADTDKDLTLHLVELLTPETEQADLDEIPKRKGISYCPYLRFQQKHLDQTEWLVGVNRQLRAGAHFPLCVFTKNSSARSEDEQYKRWKKNKDRAAERTAVAEASEAGDERGSRG